MEELLIENEEISQTEPEKKKRSGQSQADKFNSAEKIIIKGQLPEVSSIMETVGFPAAEVKKAESLLSKGRTAIVTRDTLHSEVVNAEEKKKMAKEMLFPRYEDRISYSKIAFDKNLPVRDALKLDEPRKETIAGVIEQSTQFYTTIFETPEWIVPLKKYSITEDLLREDFDLLTEYKSAIIAKEKAENESVEATRLRNEALEELFDWVKEYKRVAKIALKHYPQLLALLGIK